MSGWNLPPGVTGMEEAINPSGPESRAERRAFGSGRKARQRGDDLAANPFPRGTDLRAAWRRGWCDEDMAIASESPEAP